MSTGDQRHKKAAALLVKLQTRHAVLKHYRPLDENSIEQALIDAHPEQAAWLIRSALHQHLNSNAYLQSLSHGGPRYALNDQAVGEVDADTRHHARTLLKHHHAHGSKRPKH